MKIIINIKTDNEAFQDGFRDYEVKRILETIPKRIENGEKDGLLRDINGNNIGKFKVTGK